MNASTQEQVVLNGINVTGLREMIGAVTARPAAGQTKWKVQSSFVHGCRSDHRVSGFSIGGEWVDRNFTLKVDEPVELGGTNAYPNPQEYLLAGINACVLTGYVMTAAAMGVKIDRLEVEITGDIDLRGLLGIDEKVAPGYESLQQTIRVSGDGTPEQFKKIHEVVLRTSPNYFNITHAVPTSSKLVVE
ncbi:MAG: OsmC family peroxiredoxin [Phycisphaera sp.]|nr:OsmC family peroxiredoxin [Phycisphaera sp.]